jgi:hypothetical protein
VALKPVAVAAIDGGSATTTTVKRSARRSRGDVVAPAHRRPDLQHADRRHAAKPGDYAADLALALNTTMRNAARYTAIADGARITIVDRLGGVFETRLDAGNISRYEATPTSSSTTTCPAVDTDASNGINDLTTQLRALYGFNDLTVTEVRNSGDVTYTVSFVRSQAGINFQQMQPVGEASAGLLPSPNARWR